MIKTPRWIIWASHPDEDSKLDRPSTIEVIRLNEYDEYEHNIFIADHNSESFKEVLEDPNWGNGDDATLIRRIHESTEEWRSLEDETAEEFEQFKEWKKNNKEKVTITSNENVIEYKEVIKFDLEQFETATSEQIFKLKLDMFEKERVQSADKKIKSQIRMSQDPFEIVSLYYSVMTPSDSEPT